MPPCKAMLMWYCVRECTALLSLLFDVMLPARMINRGLFETVNNSIRTCPLSRSLRLGDIR